MSYRMPSSYPSASCCRPMRISPLPAMTNTVRSMPRNWANVTVVFAPAGMLKGLPFPLTCSINHVVHQHNDLNWLRKWRLHDKHEITQVDLLGLSPMSTRSRRVTTNMLPCKATIRHEYSMVVLAKSAAKK